MLVLTLLGGLAVLFLVIGFLCWLGLWIFRVRRVGRTVFKWTAVAFLIAAPTVLFVGLPLLASSLIANSGTRPMDLRLDLDPATFGCSFEEVTFPSRDGVSLSGWWMEGEPGLPAFALTHGLFRDRKEVVERACRLNQLGFGALALDLRRHGKSGGKSVSMGYLERLDVLGASDWLKGKSGTGIVPLGVSMGASATLEAGPEFGPEVVAIVADSPFLSLRETVDRHVGLFVGLPAFPFANVFIWNLTRINGFQADQLNAAEAVARMRPIPTLLIYGADDNRMPAATAEAVFQAIPHAKKELVFFEGAGHGAAWRSDPDRYLRVIVDFLGRMGVAAPDPGLTGAAGRDSEEGAVGGERPDGGQ